MANENLKAQEIYGIRIKELPQVTEVNDTDDIIIENSTPITSRVKIGTLFGSIKNPYKNKTIVAFGDSIIAGWGWKEGTGIIQPLKEKYPNATWINKAESGANMAVTSNPSHTPIVNQITSYTGAADAIIFDGGVNDKNNGLPIGSIETNYDGATATFGNNSVTLDNAGNFTLTSPYYIGCMSKNGEAAGAGLKGKIYYAKIYSGSNLVADMIPVKKSDGTLCLYDKVRKKYIYNAGTGTLKDG